MVNGLGGVMMVFVVVRVMRADDAPSTFDDADPDAGRNAVATGRRVLLKDGDRRPAARLDRGDDRVQRRVQHDGLVHLRMREVMVHPRLTGVVQNAAVITGAVGLVDQ